MFAQIEARDVSLVTATATQPTSHTVAFLCGGITVRSARESHIC